MLNLAVDANRLVGIVVAVDELLDAHLGHVAERREHGFELVGVSYVIGVGRSRPGDRFDNDRRFRETDRGGGLPAAVDGGDTRMSRRTDTRLVEALFS